MLKEVLGSIGDQEESKHIQPGKQRFFKDFNQSAHSKSYRTKKINMAADKLAHDATKLTAAVSRNSHALSGG